MQPTTSYKYLARDPGSSYRQLFIKGRGVSARTLYGQYMSEEEPQTPEQIAENWDLPLEAVQEAITYCQSDPPEIRQDFAMEEALMELSGMNDPDYKKNPRTRPFSLQEYVAAHCRIYGDHDDSVEPVPPYKYLARDPGSSYRQLFIKGRSVSARTLYGQYMSEEEPQTPEQIAENWGLPLEAVQEAITYCQSDPPEIRQDFAFDEALAEASGMNDPNYKYHPSPKPLSGKEIADIFRRIYGE